MGRSIRNIIAIGFLLSFNTLACEAQEITEYDSIELSKDSIYICEEHYFEWCKEASICAYCGEPLDHIDLWTYYKILECEDCKKYFEDHYEDFIQE